MKKKLLIIFSTALLLVLWQYAGSQWQTLRLLISTPIAIGYYFAQNLQDLLWAAWTTTYESVAGLSLAILFSFSMMILCFFKPRVMDIVLPVMITSQVVPLIVLSPFFIILLGIGAAPKIAMAALMCFFPIFVNFAQGYRAINHNIHELMYIYNAPLKFRIKKVYFPLSMSSIMAGLKISATLSVIGAIVAEFNGAELGLGKNLFLSAKRLEPEMMMSSLVLSTLLGGAMYGLITLIEKKYGKWYL